MPSRSSDRQRNRASLRQVLLNPPKVCVVHRLVRRRDVPVRGHQLRDGSRRCQSGRTRFGEEPRNEFRPVGRQLEQRLVHQLHVEVAAPDVGDERDARANRGDVGEVLFGSNSEVHAAGFRARHQFRHDLREDDLVREPGCPTETSRSVRRNRAEAPVFGAGQLRRQAGNRRRLSRDESGLAAEDRKACQKSDDGDGWKMTV